MVQLAGQIDDLLNPIQGNKVDRHEALKNPAQSRALGAFAQLIGEGLVGLLQSLTKSPLSQGIDQQTRGHHEGEGHDALKRLEEDTGGEE